jgi:hypothetical protein
MSDTLLEAEVWVNDSTGHLRYMVLMQLPADAGQPGEAELVPLVAHDCMPGVVVSE